MERCLLSSRLSPLRFSEIPRSFPLFAHPKRYVSHSSCRKFQTQKDLLHGFGNSPPFFNSVPSRTSLFCTKAVLSPEIPSQKKYSKVAAESTGPIPSNQLLQVVETAAKTGAEVVMDAVNKPRTITYKGLTDLVTETDKMSEAAILEVVRKNFSDHLILGEEGGLIGDSSSDYLWCIDPLDGTTNFAHCYPSFAVSVGVLFRGKPAAAAVVEFVGGPMCWNTRIFSAVAGGGAFCYGQKIHVSLTDKVERSLLVTGFGYEHDDAWATNIELFKEYTDVSRGVRRLGAAAVDMCHVALGIVEAYWEYRLKPWDMAAGVLNNKLENVSGISLVMLRAQKDIQTFFRGLNEDDISYSSFALQDTKEQRDQYNVFSTISSCLRDIYFEDQYYQHSYDHIVEEAGGVVSCMDGENFCVFDRSVLVSNGVLHAQLLERIGPATEKLKNKGIDFSLWFKPEDYRTEL